MLKIENIWFSGQHTEIGVFLFVQLSYFPSLVSFDVEFFEFLTKLEI